MCRLAAYIGHPLLISQVVTEPRHSIIHQSYHSEERTVPTNGDGSGIAWFVPHVSHQPSLFKDVRPAWNDENLIEIARVTSSHCILAHVRAASPQSPVQRLNCHPFAHERLAFMHNGGLGGFQTYRRQLLASLSDKAFHAILGSTDSEHAFAVFIDHYDQLGNMAGVDRLAEAMQRTLERLEALKLEAGVTEPSACNFAVADGNAIVVTRFMSPGAGDPPSLHFLTGRSLRLKDGHYKMDYGEDPDVVLIASERLNGDVAWQDVPGGSMILATHPGKAELRPIRASLVPPTAVELETPAVKLQPAKP
jgi:predicted glutamine amidotransferase